MNGIEVEEDPNGGYTYKRPKEGLTPEELLQRQLEEEERRLGKHEAKAARQQNKLDSTLEKERQRRMREMSREQQRLQRESQRALLERQKAEERARKAMLKEQERLERERQKQQAKEERENARLAKLSEKEELKRQQKEKKDEAKLAKKREREQLRKEKAAERRSAAASRLKLREVGPPDDLDVELIALRAQARARGLAVAESAPQELVRPPFPPPHITSRRKPAFTGELQDNDCELAGNVLVIWNFLAMFAEHTGLRPCSLHELLVALRLGTLSPLLVNLHIAMLRFVQADAENAHLSGASQLSTERADKAYVSAATLVDEGARWGVDLSVWRAHVNVATWPEVLRQFAVVAGWGPRRCRPRRARERLQEGNMWEDIEEGDGTIRLRWPSRFQANPTPGEHTVKEACWKVLASMVANEDDIKTAKDGLPIREIARRIEEMGLRSSKGSSTNEGSVAGALSRDQLFFHVAPGTYALHAVVAYWRKHKDRLEGNKPADGEAAKPDDAAASTPAKDSNGAAPMDVDSVKPDPGAAASVKQEAGAAPSAVKAEPGPADAKPPPAAAAAAQPAAPPAAAAGTAQSDAVKDEAKPRVKEESKDEANNTTPNNNNNNNNNNSNNNNNNNNNNNDDDESSSSDDDDEDYHRAGKSWVEKLRDSDYDALSLGERVEALCDLLHQVLDTPSMRALLERRCDEVERVKKAMRDEAKNERRKRQEELAAKAKADAAEAAQRVLALREQMAIAKGTAAGGGTFDAAGTPAAAPTGAAAAAPASAGTTPGATPGDGTVAGVEPATDDSEAKRQQHERDVSAAAAEEKQREVLGERLRITELTNAVRGEPFGRDRRFNRYYWFGQQTKKAAPATLLPDRVFVEDCDTGAFTMYTRHEDMKELGGLLEVKGARENAFARALEQNAEQLASSLPSAANGLPPPAAIGLPPPLEALPRATIAQLQGDMMARLGRIQTAGMQVLGEEGQSRETDYLPDDPPAVRKLKSELLCVESAIPEQAMADTMAWDRATWIRAVQSARALPALRRLLGELEASLKEDWLSKEFTRAPLLVKGAFLPVGKEVAVGPTAHALVEELREADAHGAEVVDEPLAWLPATTAAITLRLLALDAAVVYRSDQRPLRETLPAYRYVQHPVFAGNSDEVATVSGNPALQKERPLFPPASLALLPAEPREFELDARIRQGGDDDHLAHMVPSGLKSSHTPEATKAKPKESSKKSTRKSKKRVEEDDAIYAADIISSDDDFDDVMATYAYGNSNVCGQTSNAVSAAGSDFGDEMAAEAISADDPSISASDEDDVDDDADFVG